MQKKKVSPNKKGNDDINLAKYTERMKKSTNIMKDELVILNMNL